MKKKHIIILAVTMVLLLIPNLALAAQQAPLPAVKLHHFLFKTGQDGNISVDEVLQWNVTGDTPEGNIELRVPDNAVEVLLYKGSSPQPVKADNLERNGDKVVTPFKWTKGNNEVRLTYKLPVTGGKAVLSTQLVYANEVLYALAPTDELSISTKQLQDLGVQNMESKEFRVFGGQNVPSGIGLEFEIIMGGKASTGRGIVSKTSPTGKIDFHSPEHLSRWYNSPLRNTNPHLWLVFLGVLIVAFLVATSLYIRKRVREAREKEDEEKLHKLFLSLQARHKKLLNNLVKIEEQLENNPYDGELLKKKKAYWELLREVKIKLKAVEEELDAQ